MLILGLLLTVFAQASEATAAPACPAGGTISAHQRKSLEKLPPHLQTILQAVRRSKKALCEAPGTPPDLALLSAGAVDPLSPPPATQVALATTAATAVPDEVVAMISGDGSNIDAIATANGLTVKSRRPSALLGGTLVLFSIPDGRSVDAVTTILQTNPAVATPGPNHLYEIQGSIYDEARFAPKKMGLPADNNALTGKDIIVGVIDTAIDPDHPDLKGAVIEHFDALPDQPVRNRRHGTAVAGLIAGRKLIKGIAPKARLLVARAFDDRRKGSKNAKASATSFALLASLDWVVGKGARIINMSFTGPRNQLLSKALAATAARKVLLIAAAGNHGPQAPAAYPAAEQSVLAVTATDIHNKIYSKANNGRYVFVAAPGVDILAAAPDEGVDLVSGTSFAAPFLTGLAALMLEQNKGLTPRQFARRIEQTSHDLGQPGRDSVFGVGLANSSRALAQK